MKRISTLFLCLTALFMALPVSAINYTVTSKADFESAFYGERTNADIDTIFVKSGGTLISLSNGSASKPMPSNGDIYIIGVDDEETGAKSGISFQFYLPINQESDHVSFHFENLIIECNGGNTANSKYLFSLKDIDFHYIQTLELKDCEIRNYNRAIFRVQPNGDREDGSKDVGEIELLNIVGCTFHNGYALNNPMALFYMGMRCATINFENNLFYDMNYVHSIVSFAYLTEGDGRIDIDFNFSNNTFIGKTMNTVFNFNDYVGQMSNFQIHNNIFMVPDWRDERNNADITDEMLAAVPDTLQRPTEKILASIMYGVGSISNNLLFGFKDARNYLDADGEGTWFLDENSHLTMEELGMTFKTFSDAQTGDFSYLGTETMATAGVDGAPLGAEWLVKNLDVPCYLTVTSSTEGVSFDPAKGVFDKGTKVTVTAIERPGAIFQEWQIAGTTVSTENPYTFTIEGDVELVAVFEEKPVANVNIKVKAPEEVVMTITPQQDVYYQGETITVTFNTHYWADFEGWSDGVKEMERTFTLESDIDLTATFAASDRIAVWDFDQVTKGKQTLDNGVGANHFLNGDSAYVGALHTAYFVNEAYKDSSIVMTRNNKFADDLRICIVRETPDERFSSNPDYNYIVVNTTGYKDIRVSSLVGVDAKAHSVQLLQYSLDGIEWKTVGSVTLEEVLRWYALEGSLPEDAAEKEAVYVRWIGDTGSAAIIHPDNADKDGLAEFSCVAAIVVKGASTKEVAANTYAIEVGEEITTGKVIDKVEGITMIYGGSSTSTWAAGKADANMSAGTGGVFEASTGGEGNNPTKNTPTPTEGTFYVFKPAVDGTLSIAIILNAGKSFYISEDGTYLADFNGITVSEKFYGLQTLHVKGGSTYYVFCAGSKLGFGGFIFDADDVHVDAVTVTEKAPIYDLMGRRVIYPARGIYIQNGKKVLLK
ncbi:MAG: hypothetical protein J5814_01660 [Bacteroidaceae bacterium]|nr:hypothetical protein [Bacteroidaceae bacterium]